MHENTNSSITAPPTIFLVEEDNNARPIFTKNLRECGYRLLVAADSEDAREWMAGESYIHADLVLVDLVSKSPEEALQIGREMRDHAKYDGHTPLIVMPEKFTKELEGTDVNLGENDWICYYEDAEQVYRLLVRLMKKDLT